ncbi:MAG: crotonobetainyl-CoA:carnitine CoA-transferase CaiB-like acyl-CoA transferase [Enterobacterales bacterium]
MPIIATEIASRTTAWWVENLEKVSVPSGPVNSLDDVFNHPQVKHREMVQELTDGSNNLIKTVASPIKMSATPLQYHSPSPELGQHTVQILKEQLNYDEEMILTAFKNDVVG